MPTHKRGARHRARVKRREASIWRCVVCDVSMPARAQFEHERTKAHAANRRNAPWGYRCEVCDVAVPRCAGGRSGGREEHELGARHRAATFRRSTEAGAEAAPKETLVPEANCLNPKF